MAKVLIIVGDASETLDTLYPYYRLQEGGFHVADCQQPSACLIEEAGREDLQQEVESRASRRGRVTL